MSVYLIFLTYFTYVRYQFVKITNIIKKCIFAFLFLTISSVYSNFTLNMHLLTKEHTNGRISHLWFFTIKKENDRHLAPILKLNAFDHNIDPHNLPRIISDLIADITYKISILERQTPFENEQMRNKEIRKLNIKNTQALRQAQDDREEEEVEGEEEGEEEENEEKTSKTFSWKQDSQEIFPLIGKYTNRTEHSFIVAGENNADILRREIIEKYGYKEQESFSLDIAKAPTTSIQDFFKNMAGKIKPYIRKFQINALRELENYIKKNYIDPSLNKEKIREIRNMIATCEVNKDFLFDMFPGFEKEVDYVVGQANKRVIKQVSEQEVNRKILEIVDTINAHETKGKSILDEELIQFGFDIKYIVEARKQIRLAKRVHHYSQKHEQMKQELFDTTPRNKKAHTEPRKLSPQGNYESEREKFFDITSLGGEKYPDRQKRKKVRVKRKKTGHMNFEGNASDDFNCFEDQNEKVQDFETVLPFPSIVPENRIEKKEPKKDTSSTETKKTKEPKNNLVDDIVEMLRGSKELDPHILIEEYKMDRNAVLAAKMKLVKEERQKSLEKQKKLEEQKKLEKQKKLEEKKKRELEQQESEVRENQETFVPYSRDRYFNSREKATVSVLGKSWLKYSRKKLDEMAHIKKHTLDKIFKY